MVNYATLTEVRAYNDYDDADTGEDAQIVALLPQVSRMIDRETGRTFAPDSDTTEYFTYEDDVLWFEDFKFTRRGHPRGAGRDLYVAHKDNFLLSVTSITNADGNSVASSEYFLLPHSAEQKHTIRLKEASTVAWEDDTDGYIEVTGKWGWSASVPEDIKLATIEAILYILKGKRSQSDYDRPQVSPSGVMLLPKALPQRVLNMIAHYKKKA